MFRGNNRKLRFLPRNGLQVVVRGRISLYEGRGDFQLIAEFMEEAGDGALRRAYDALKNQLQKEGLFSLALKKQPPVLPQHLAIITSPTGAAVRDVLHILKRRFPALPVSIIPVLVQGEESVHQIVDAIKFANDYGEFDTILLTRGGGSLEDLWSFNTEPVARAIAESKLPIVSAIGHEVDTSISDYVADVRAPTPSAAAELLSPDSETWIHKTIQLESALVRANKQIQEQLNSHMQHLRRRLRHPGQRLQDLYQRLDDLEARLTSSYRHFSRSFNLDPLMRRLNNAMTQKLGSQRMKFQTLESKALDTKPLLQEINRQSLLVNNHYQLLSHRHQQMKMTSEHRLKAVLIKLNGANPLTTLTKGFAIVTKDQQVVKDAATLKAGDVVQTQVMSGSFSSEVLSTNESNNEKQ
jgi:exodeoxyribonuclease VII large subunit